MASSAYCKKLVDGKKKAIEKLEKKLARIKVAKQSNYEENNPYCYSDYDLRMTEKDLEEARKLLKKYETDMLAALEKENSRNVKPILDFLDMWKARAKDFHMDLLREYFEEKGMVRKLYDKVESCTYDTKEYEEAMDRYEEAQKTFHENTYGKYHKEVKESLNGRKREVSVKDCDGKYEIISPYVERNLQESEEKLDKVLKAEAERKYDDIIERTNHIAGQITDASNLEVDARCNLNGYITGTKGKARVETIGAGGYNIQCFHFRTLINKIK